jgi:hypothetical protein
VHKRHHHLFVIAPFGPDFAPAPKTPEGARVAQVLAEEERRRLDQARRELSGLGVHVVAAPNDSADALVRRFLRARAGARRAG